MLNFVAQCAPPRLVLPALSTILCLVPRPSEVYLAIPQCKFNLVLSEQLVMLDSGPFSLLPAKNLIPPLTRQWPQLYPTVIEQKLLPLLLSHLQLAWPSSEFSENVFSLPL